MSWVRMPATVRAGTGPSCPWLPWWYWYRLNCSSWSPRTSQRSSASLTSSGTVPRFSPTIVVPVPGGLGGDDGEDLLAGVAHVDAVAGAGALGDPPQPLHAHHVVDAQHRGVLAGPGDELPPQRRGRCAGRPPAAAAGSPSSGRRRRTRPGARRRTCCPRTGRGGPTSRSRRDGCRSAGRAPAGPGPDPRPHASWRWARYWARRWLRSTSAAGRADVGRVGRAARNRAKSTTSGRSATNRSMPAWMYGSRSAAASSSWLRRRRASTAPVDQLLERRRRGGRERRVVEVDLVPVQPADR